jgi:23S rRNA pseudouridine1911/1915/1917 synthase
MASNITFIAELHENTERIDQILSKRYPDRTRSFFAQLIRDQQVLINNIICKKTGKSIAAGDQITVNFQQKELIRPEKNVSSLNISIIFEHEHFLIIHKPAGIVVHETTSQNKAEITVVDWLLHHYPALSSVGYSGRPGIVHRLDKDTSGIMIIPKTSLAHHYFANLFKNRGIKKEYHALVVGTPPRTGSIDLCIGRDQKYRTKMKAFSAATQKKLTVKTKEAKTHFMVKQYFKQHTYVILHPETGRTHQIRVHCADSGFAVLADSVYGKPSLLISRQALHAYSLSFSFQNQDYFFFADIPEDMKQAIRECETIQHNTKS